MNAVFPADQLDAAVLANTAILFWIRPSALDRIKEILSPDSIAKENARLTSKPSLDPRDPPPDRYAAASRHKGAMSDLYQRALDLLPEVAPTDKLETAKILTGFIRDHRLSSGFGVVRDLLESVPEQHCLEAGKYAFDLSQRPFPYEGRDNDEGRDNKVKLLIVAHKLVSRAPEKSQEIFDLRAQIANAIPQNIRELVLSLSGMLPDLAMADLAARGRAEMQARRYETLWKPLFTCRNSPVRAAATGHFAYEMTAQRFLARTHIETRMPLPRNASGINGAESFIGVAGPGHDPILIRSPSVSPYRTPGTYPGRQAAWHSVLHCA